MRKSRIRKSEAKSDCDIGPIENILDELFSIYFALGVKVVNCSLSKYILNRAVGIALDVPIGTT